MNVIKLEAERCSIPTRNGPASTRVSEVEAQPGASRTAVSRAAEAPDTGLQLIAVGRNQSREANDAMRSPTTHPNGAVESAAPVPIMPIDAFEDRTPQDDRTGSQAPDGSHPITGRLTGGSTVTGAIRDVHASVVNGNLTLTGSLTLAEPPTKPGQFAQTLTLSQLYVNSDCTVLIVDPGAVGLGQIGVVNVIPVVFSVEPGSESGSARLLPAMFGWLAGLLDVEGPVEGIATLLNQIFTSLGLRH